MLTLNSCSHIVGSHVMSFSSECDLLEKWASFVREVDPDVVIGYNIAGFDFPYLLDRAAAIKANKFPYLGRVKGRCTYRCDMRSILTPWIELRTRVKDTHFSSKAYGTRDSKETPLDGRLQLDLLQYMQREYKLRSYTLNAVCSQFLGEQKEDVHHSDITMLHNGTPDSRRRLAIYCLKVCRYKPIRYNDLKITKGCRPSSTSPR